MTKRSIFKWTMIGVVTLVISAIAIPYVWVLANEKPFDDRARALAPGKFVELTSGKLHYLWVEPAPENANDETIVMLHGLYLPNFVFKQNAEALAGAGYRVLLLDHFGHGFSDRPRENYDSVFFVREVSELLDAVGVDTPVYLAGQSMGGMIATHFATAHPERVKALLLMVPAGLRLTGSDDDFMSNTLRIPIIGDWVWTVVVRRLLLTPQPICETCGEGRLVGNFYLQAEYRGYFPAMLNILRHLPMRYQDKTYQSLENGGIATLAIFADGDDTVHIDSAEVLASLVSNAKIVVIESSGHGVNFRRYKEVNSEILSFIDNLASDNETENIAR